MVTGMIATLPFMSWNVSGESKYIVVCCLHISSEEKHPGQLTAHCSTCRSSPTLSLVSHCLYCQPETAEMVGLEAMHTTGWTCLGRLSFHPAGRMTRRLARMKIEFLTDHRLGKSRGKASLKKKSVYGETEKQYHANCKVTATNHDLI